MNRFGMLKLFLVLGVLGVNGLHYFRKAQAEEPTRAAALGDKLAGSSSLRDLRGNRRSLHGFTGHKAIVLVFLGTDCPISNLYLPGLLDLEKRYRPKQVQFLAVYPNEHEDLDQVAAHASDRDVPFPVLKDFGQRLAAQAGVTRLPAVVVLDGDFVLRYRGRIDDRYGVGVPRDQRRRATTWARPWTKSSPARRSRWPRPKPTAACSTWAKPRPCEQDRVHLCQACGSHPAKALPGLPPCRADCPVRAARATTTRSSTRP